MVRQSADVEKCPDQWGLEEVEFLSRLLTHSRRCTEHLGVYDGEVVRPQKLIHEQLRLPRLVVGGSGGLLRRFGQW
jgi:hypothetical protein